MIKYLITDPKFYTNDKKHFEDKLTIALKNKVEFACFRDKESSNFEELAQSFVKICKEKDITQYLINTDINLAKKLNASGVHLNSTQFDKIKVAKELNLYVIISCHTEEEIKKAIELKADAITYSPIFYTPNKGEPKGIKNLESIICKYPEIRIIALGGIINDSQLKQIEKTNAYGFASIRYFV